MPNTDFDYLAWLLGPKAEHGDFLERLVLTVVRDQVHWRRNYFPGDPRLIDAALSRQLQEGQSQLEQAVHEMLSELRRTFPFYSPRYIGHMLSDTSVASIVGYLAGMLHNPNNVTTEAAPVTVDWEIRACNALLELVGFRPPPSPPAPHADHKEYLRALEQQFGWCHTTMGGTTANLEALWVARSVRYLPLAVRAVAIKSGLDISWKRGTDVVVDLRKLEEFECLLLKPNEAIYLLARYVAAVGEHLYDPSNDGDDLSAHAWRLLEATEYAPSKGPAAAMTKYPPVVFVTGAAHYSINKAVEILGLGRAAIQHVKMHTDFTVDTEDLREQLLAAVARRCVPLAVIAIAGTTEEGAVDSVHEVADLRKSLEAEKGISFWLHIDAAWGGYFRTLFVLSEKEQHELVRSKISRKLGIPPETTVREWTQIVVSRLRASLTLADRAGMEEAPASHSSTADAHGRAVSHLRKLESLADDAEFDAYLSRLQRLIADCGARLDLSGLVEADLRLTLSERQRVVQEYVSDDVTLEWGNYRRTVRLQWGGERLCSAFLAFDQADSVTLDPHKMGYVQYPCGAIAFRNDRVRHFVLQNAPYITSLKANQLVHRPPKRLERNALGDGHDRVAIEAFARFIVEGSRPGAVAAGLWLAIRTAPLTMRQHGAIMRASLLAARELFEWIRGWSDILTQERVDVDYEIVPLFPMPPHTNVVCFVVRKRTSRSLEVMNAITEAVYKQHFTIEAELGAREYSYSQPFFLSFTRCTKETYAHGSMSELLKRCDIVDPRAQYEREGLSVIRAVVMNPYVYPLRVVHGVSLFREFMDELHVAARQACREKS